MGGRPVWLASVSLGVRDWNLPTQRRLVPNTRWTFAQRETAKQILRNVTRGVGDPGRWRLFRMQITYCLHKALTDDELAVAEGQWSACPISDMAGGPVEVLASRGIPPELRSPDPCKSPSRVPIPGADYDPELWVPEDCGECAPCLARAAIDSEPLVVTP